MTKELRRKKVFIDWSQNSDFKTTVGVYSLRAKNDIPYISAPVTWAELERLQKTNDPDLLRFQPKAVLKRVVEMGDLFAPLLTLKQILSPITERGSVAAPAEPKIIEAVPSKNPGAKSRRVQPAVPSAKFVEPMLLLKTHKLPE